METLTETQKQKIQHKIENYVKRLENKKNNNDRYYKERKLSSIHCDCCNKDIDSYYYTKHCETKKHIENSKKLKQQN